MARIPRSAVRRWGIALLLVGLGVAAGLTSPLAGGVVLLGALVLFVVQYALHRVARRHEHLDAVHAFTRDVGNAVADGTVIPTTLQLVVTLLQVERASLMLLDDGAGRGCHLSLVTGQGQRHDPVDPAALRRVIDGLPSDRWGGVHATATTAPELVTLLRTEDALVVRLGTVADPVGILVAADRRPGAERFDNGDLELLRVMGAHAGAAIANDVLVSRLRTQAEERDREVSLDPLTGLLSRHGLLRALDADMSRIPTGVSVGLVVIDIDRFHEVDEGLGLDLADRYLQRIAERIAENSPAGALTARVGNDEFAVAVTSDRVRDQLTLVARGIATAFREPIELEGMQVDVAGTFGVAVAPDHADRPDLLLQRATVAQRTATRAGKPLITYTRREADETPRRLAMVGELRRALAEGQLRPYYQPKIDLRTGQIVGCEALIRWFHPEHGMIPPGEFIPLAEQTGLIGPLTEQVVLASIAQLAAWNARGHDIGVSVNLSARNLSSGDLARDVAVAVHASGIRADRLTLEVTESTVMDGTGRSDRTLQRLDDLGVGLSIDDFGTGYSSLSYLRSLPVDELKIDRSFVMRLPAEPDDQVIVRSTLDLAHSLGLITVAEGVEDAETMELLQEMGADLVQGYHCGRPMPADELTARLDEQAAQVTEAPAPPRRGVVVDLPTRTA